MKLDSLSENIFLAKFRSQSHLTHTFVRFQEYYESPHFKGKYFAISKFRHWYTSNSPQGKKTGRFSFYHDLAGFNIPCHVLKPFYKGKFDPLTHHEQSFLSTFQDMKDKFYVIGVYGNRTKSVLKHEIGHALFYLNKDYRKEVLDVVHDIDKKAIHQIYRFLAETKFYHHHVWLDEVHAYVLAALEDLKQEKVDIKLLQEPHKKINAIFKRYYSGSGR
ncbi:MAG TPA: hypothetical protein VJI15_05760 [Candidatus Nanoarchaeia archaeon]|nr:hypothetical protein [Candidatus Nanoarchaeia archaeon]